MWDSLRALGSRVNWWLGLAGNISLVYVFIFGGAAAVIITTVVAYAVSFLDFVAAIPLFFRIIFYASVLTLSFALVNHGWQRLAAWRNRAGAPAPRPRTARTVSTQDIAVGEADPPPKLAAHDGRKALCLHLADELEQEHERYENDEQKITSWAAGLSGSGISEDDFDQQVANAQDDNFTRTLNKYNQDLKGRLLDLYGTLDPQGWLGDGDRARIENLNDPYQMRDLAKRLREVCSKLSGDLDALGADEPRQRIARWRAEIRNGNFNRTPHGASEFVRTDTYTEMSAWLSPKLRERFEGDVLRQATIILGTPPHERGAEGDRRVLLREAARIAKEWGAI